MAQVFAVAVMLGVAFWGALPVEACTCAEPSPEQALNTSDLAFLGRVVKAELVSPNLIRVDVAVGQTFKGDSRKSIGIYTRPRAASCNEYGFQVGEQYLIFATRPATRAPELRLSDLPSGEYITGACHGTVNLATTQGVDWLRAIRLLFEKR